LKLSAGEIEHLRNLGESRTAPWRETQRARIMLRYHSGESIARIARAVGMTRKSVGKWVGKALAMGSGAALKDAYHRPKASAITEDAKAWVVHLACSKPKDLGYAAEVWTRSALARHVREHARKAGYASLAQAAKATVHRILAEQPLHPEKVKYYLARRDPEFEAKMRDVLLVYQQVALQNQNGGMISVVTVSVDESPVYRRLPIPPRTCRQYLVSIPASAATTNTNALARVPFWPHWICTLGTLPPESSVGTAAASLSPC
jgi:transposase